MTPTLNGLYSRKDARRPGVVRVIDIVAGDVLWQSIEEDKDGVCPVLSWERRYRPFEAPQQTTAPADGAEGK